ncbi:TPA: hypothetical protein ACOSB6_002960, partial [Salmonella enterica]
KVVDIIVACAWFCIYADDDVSNPLISANSVRKPELPFLLRTRKRTPYRIIFDKQSRYYCRKSLMTWFPASLCL